MTDTPGRIALLDWDNSLHLGFTMGPWMHQLARDAAETLTADRFDRALADYEAGSLAYDTFALLAEQLYTVLMDGRHAADVEAVAAHLVPIDPLRPGTPELIAALLALDIRPILVSGAPIEVLRAHAAALGIAPGDVTGWQHGPRRLQGADRRSARGGRRGGRPRPRRFRRGPSARGRRAPGCLDRCPAHGRIAARPLDRSHHRHRARRFPHRPCSGHRHPGLTSGRATRDRLRERPVRDGRAVLAGHEPAG